MRLQILSVEAMRPIQRFKLRLFKWLVAGYIPPPFIPMSYRRELFGQHFISAFQDTMRRASDWQVGELELFAAFVSKQNSGQY